jgi:predicted Zn-dependent protease
MDFPSGWKVANQPDAVVAVALRYENTTYVLLGLTVPQVASPHGPAVESTRRSFRALTDQAALGVQPARVLLVTLDQTMTGQQFVQRYPSTVPVEQVFIMNGIEAGAALPRGTVLKRVVSGVGK